jgi:hypothetical protein
MRTILPATILLILLCFSLITYAQVGIGTQTVDNSAMLETNSSDKGFLPPRMTTAQRTAIASPATGLMVYNTSINCLEFYNGSSWENFCGAYTSPVNGIDSTQTGIAIVICGTPPGCPDGLYANPANASAGDSICFGSRIYHVIEGDYDGPDGGAEPDYLWLDRNLGANRLPTSSLDPQSFGDYYQWGRLPDGHQCVGSPTTATTVNVDVPGHSNFITNTSSPYYDWRVPQNDNLWQGLNGINNPCPPGWRIPTQAEFDDEEGTWSPANSSGAYNSALRFPIAGVRDDGSGNLGLTNYIKVWSSTPSSTNNYAMALYASSGGSGTAGDTRASGQSVRCIKD